MIPYNKLIPGKVYYQIPYVDLGNGKKGYISRFIPPDKDTFLRITLSGRFTDFTTKGSSSPNQVTTIRLATPGEIERLEICERAGRFIDPVESLERYTI